MFIRNVIMRYVLVW